MAQVTTESVESLLGIVWESGRPWEENWKRVVLPNFGLLLLSYTFRRECIAGFAMGIPFAPGQFAEAREWQWDADKLNWFHAKGGAVISERSHPAAALAAGWDYARRNGFNSLSALLPPGHSKAERLLVNMGYRPATGVVSRDGSMADWLKFHKEFQS